nr:carboxylesterase 1 [Ipomoea batatas]
MGSEDSSEILHDFFPLMRVYKDGRVQRFSGEEVVPADVDGETGVKCKDVEISPDPKVSARLYLPKGAGPGRKLPVLVYFHGGGFIVESAFSPTYMKHLCLVSAEANAVIVSVNYRLAPEHPLPAAYDDSWAALKWVAAHSNGGGDEEWLKEYVDFDRVFLGGDSAGGTIAHSMAMRVGLEGLNGVKIDGVILNCPFFWGKDPIPGEGDDEGVSIFVENLWRFVNPKTTGLDDPQLCPDKNPEYAKLGCKRVLVYVAEQDPLRHRGRRYTAELAKQGWQGESEVVEAKGENHVFNLFTPTSDNAMAMVKKLATFFNPSSSIF